MRLIQGPAGSSGQNLQAFRGATVTIGNFDGLHLGHRALLEAAVAFGGPRVVITFDPHPVQVLYPERNLRRLLPAADLRERLPDFGVDLLLALEFNADLAQMSAASFLRAVVEPLAPRALVVGYDFGFGRAREGTLDGLGRWARARDVSVVVVPPFEIDGSVVSSRRLRGLIAEGDVAAARRLLGRPFYLRGRVGRGAGRGAGLGWPTLNQTVENETFPGVGVYASRARLSSAPASAALISVTNVGRTPTFGDAPGIKVETHVIDQTVRWRDESIDVELIARLRDERKFADVGELKAQIARDVAAARAALNNDAGDQP